MNSRNASSMVSSILRPCFAMKTGRACSRRRCQNLFLISPASFDLADGVRVAELETLRMILPSSRHTLRALYDAVFRQAEITPNIIAKWTRYR